MPFYSWQHPNVMDPADIIDRSTGLSVDSVTWVDTDTGTLEQIVRDHRGEMVFDPATDDIARRIVRGDFEVKFR